MATSTPQTHSANNTKNTNTPYCLDSRKQVLSISGGRTSHYMISVIIKLYGKENVDFVYCDTGAEHEGTYQFIRDTEKHFNIKITCLRLFMPKEEGKGGEYHIVDINDLGKDYKAFTSLMEKYGRPFNPGGKFCTDQMKTQIYRKYCKDVYGKDGYTTWIGYRDEPKDSSRSWGHTLSGTLSKWFDIPQREQGEFYKECTYKLQKSAGTLVDFVAQHIEDSVSEGGWKRVMKVVDRVIKNHQLGYRFLFEVSDFDKQDILDWWGEQPFDLNIPPHCGNCVFCIEKTVNQLSYLCHTQNEEANTWKITLDNPVIPIKGRKLDEKAMYRDGARKMTFDEVYEEAMQQPLEYWEEKVGMEKRLSPCAGGSCDLYGTESELS